MKRLISSHLTFADENAEDEFVLHCLNEMNDLRDKMGVQTTSRDYITFSVLWRWDCYQKAYEQDFQHRENECLLFRESNYSLNLPMTPVNQHGDKMANDILSDPAFFEPKPEGNEDENPAVDILMQRLKARSRAIDLNGTAKNGMMGALIRGQEFLRASLNEGFYMKPVLTQTVTYQGAVLKDSAGQPVMAEDKWVKMDAYPDLQFLERDKKVSLPAGAEMQMSKPKVVMQRVSLDPGCDLSVIHYGDFYFQLNAPSLDACPTKGHVFNANPGDLLIGYAPETHEPAYQVYMDAYKADSLTGGDPTNTYVVRADINRLRDGEDENVTKASTANPKRFRERTYVEHCTRYDVHNDGYPVDVMVLIDLQAKIPVHYDYSSIILPWSKAKHPHPYLCQRIWPKLSRMTGRGYYELLQTWATIADKMLNRIEVDANTSGNVIFENMDATMQGIDGPGIQFRNGEAYQLRAGFTAEDALQAKVIEPANVGVFSELMEKAVGRAEINAGLTSPADSTVADVPGQDTLGVAKILENTSNQSLRARENEIVKGLTDILIAFLEIEIYAILNTEGGMKSLREQVGQEEAAILIQWLQSVPEQVRSTFEVSLTKSHSSQMVEVGNAIVSVLDRYEMKHPAIQQAEKSVYGNILKGLGDSTPDITLQSIQAATMQIQAEMAAQAEAQMAAEAAGKPPAPPTENR